MNKAKIMLYRGGIVLYNVTIMYTYWCDFDSRLNNFKLKLKSSIELYIIYLFCEEFVIFTQNCIKQDFLSKYISGC